MMSIMVGELVDELNYSKDFVLNAYGACRELQLWIRCISLCALLGTDSVLPYVVRTAQTTPKDPGNALAILHHSQPDN